MAAAVEIAALTGPGPVDAALGTAAAAGRFGGSDVAAILDHQATEVIAAGLVTADENHSTQPGTASWVDFGTTTTTSTTNATDRTKETAR